MVVIGMLPEVFCNVCIIHLLLLEVPELWARALILGITGTVSTIYYLVSTIYGALTPDTGGSLCYNCVTCTGSCQLALFSTAVL